MLSRRIHLHTHLGRSVNVAIAIVICATTHCLAQDGQPITLLSDQSSITASGTGNGVLTISDRGQNFAAYEWVVPVIGVDGNTRFRTNSFTLLENNLNYLASDPT